MNNEWYYSKYECDCIRYMLMETLNYLYTHTVEENTKYLIDIIEDDKYADINSDSPTCYVLSVYIYIITLYKLGSSNERAIYHIKTSIEQIGDLLARIDIYGLEDKLYER